MPLISRERPHPIWKGVLFILPIRSMHVALKLTTGNENVQSYSSIAQFNYSNVLARPWCKCMRMKTTYMLLVTSFEDNDACSKCMLPRIIYIYDKQTGWTQHYSATILIWIVRSIFFNLADAEWFIIISFGIGLLLFGQFSASKTQENKKSHCWKFQIFD